MLVANKVKKLHRVAVVIGALILGGCGGSGTDPVTSLLDPVVEVVTAPDVTTPDEITNTTEPEVPVLNSTLTGRVIDAVTGSPLSGATITVSVPGITESISGTTGIDGSYEVLSAAGQSSSATFEYEGYNTEQYRSIDLNADGILDLGSVRLVSNDNAGLGTLTGTISNALDGIGVEGLTLRFRQGINVTTGEVIATATTDSNGDYSVSDLPYGNLTCEIIGVGFDTSFATVIALGSIVQSDQNTAVSPDLSTGEIRIVLTWGSTPRDLDSHLTGPLENSDLPFRVYFGNRNSELANLDVDDTSSFGPETVTIERQINGVYRYSVNNYSNNNDTELSASGARVQVFDDSGVIRDYQVPAGRGNLWTVFEMEAGNISTLNTIVERTGNSQYFAASFQTKVPAAVDTRLYK